MDNLLEYFEADKIQTAKRMVNNRELYISLLYYFSKDKTYHQLTAALEQNDYQEAFLTSHMLKGLAANLGISILEQRLSQLTKEFRRQLYREK